MLLVRMIMFVLLPFGMLFFRRTPEALIVFVLFASTEVFRGLYRYCRWRNKLILWRSSMMRFAVGS